MKVRPSTIELDDEQRAQIARYEDGETDKAWCDEDGEEIPGRARLATHAECKEYVDFALTERLERQELKDHADQAEGAI